MRLCFAIALACALPRSASAQAAPAPAGEDALDEAKRHFTQGVALYNDGNFGAALAEFEASNRAHPSVGVLYNIGLCLKGQFRYAESIETLQRFLREAQPLPKVATPERRAEVEQLIGEMRALLVTVP